MSSETCYSNKSRFNPYQVVTKHQKTWENSSFSLGAGGPLVAISDQLSWCWPSWMSTITRSYENDDHGSIINDIDRDS